ncbi:hypothetical protein ARA02_06485 [Leuconostoc mesenteroides subsp. jonggajibkimchii]|uniref:glycosyltransferase n=1 Tax=Leuconostoc mesenteroides TaxID=1245 RepID=UPI0009037313|nr:glycosyltransferase [Leuconostoc mesenteroides]APE76988.1 hypothetical protein ARA02_06485 [Leuconostoc mesenteroides subsp. jonggajibkimchii]
MNKNNIIIAMATYNGETYLEEQIESIINQSYQNWRLIIQDDGSTDDTIGIVHKYISQDQRICLVKNDSNEHGAYANFYTLLEKIKNGNFGNDYNYIALSDQDDIWLECKLEMLLKNIKYTDVKQPVLVYSDYSIMDAYGNTVFESADALINLEPNVKESIFFSNSYVWGNTVLFNRALLESINFSEKIINKKYPHDAFLAKVATVIGQIIFVDTSLVRYRRFDKNESAGMWYKASFSSLLNKVNFKTRAKTLGVTLDQSLAVLINYDQYRNKKIVHAIQSGGFIGAYYLIKHRVWKKQFVRSAGIYITMIIGLYKRWLNT